jgi:RHS repeat-associated protein
MGNVTNRSLPGGLQWRATFNHAGQMLQEWNQAGGTGMRTNAYAYFAGGSPFAGLLQTKTDGRGVNCTYAYDAWLRATNLNYSGTLPEQNLTTTYQFEPRGRLTGITETFGSTNTGPATSVSRSFDPYGQLSAESVNGGSFGYSSSQSWDAAGRRTILNIGSGSYGFNWRADGNLASASDPTGSGNYTFDTAGLLTSRIVGTRVTSTTSRDGEGRPLSIATTVNTLAQLTESLAWSGDGLLASHTLTRSDFTDARSYAYANLSRRLTQEQLNLNGSTTWTNNFAYDNATASGPGVLTGMGQGSALWAGVPDAFSRIGTETNNMISYAAYGHVNGQSTLSALLDGQPVSVTGIGTNAMQWRAAMELTAGTHQLKLAALHPSGQFTALATNTFTNTIAYQTTGDTFDNAGNITQRVWRNPNGTTNKLQTLSWDARGRLYAMTERDANNSGYNWTAIYDGANRRLSTTAILVTNGVAFTSLPKTINQFYDPLVEFLELGVSYGTKTEFKLMGPDLNGKYGGLNGVGGFDAVFTLGGTSSTSPTISDFRGNILAEITNGAVTWFASRPTGYGAVPGYRPLTLGSGADISLASAWRGRWMDVTGNYNIGLRPYNPIAGNWLSYDSAWNEKDPNYLTFCGGDPVNGFDSNGKCVENAPPSLNITETAPQSSQNQNDSGLSYDTTSLVVGDLGLSQATVQFGSGAVTIGDNAKPYFSGWGGNQYVSTTKIANIADKVALPLAVFSVGVDTYGVFNGDISPAKYTVNTGFTGIGFVAPPFGAIAAGEYFLIDTAYPGGAPGFLKDSKPAAASFVNSIFWTVP